VAASRYLAEQATTDENAVMTAARHMHDPTAFDYQSPYRHAAQRLAEQAIERFNTTSRHAASRRDDLGTKVIASPGFLPVPHTSWYEEPLHWGEDAVNAVGHAFGAAWSLVSSNPLPSPRRDWTCWDWRVVRRSWRRQEPPPEAVSPSMVRPGFRGGSVPWK
jgi:hypothetical protein